MKKSGKIFFFLFFALFVNGFSQATYQISAGFRFGPTTGVTYKAFARNNVRYEIFIGSRIGTNNTFIYGMYDWNTNIANVWTFFSGMGLHMGSKETEFEQNTFAMGINGALGVEYSFFRAPFNVSLEYKPQLDMMPSPSELWFDEFAISLRYVIR